MLKGVKGESYDDCLWLLQKSRACAALLKSAAIKWGYEVFAAPYLTLMSKDTPQREYPPREVFNGLGYLIRGGTPWRLKAGVLEALAHDLCVLLRLGAAR
jgi:hypothetical protein